MNLVGYTATALSRNDIEDTPTNKNVVDFAIVELKDLQGNLVVMYDDAEGANPETQKTCDTNGQVTFFAEIGDYDLEINGKAQRINLAANIADYIKLETGESVQEFADSFALKIFQSPTDGGLTEIQTRTVNANEVYEVRKTSDDSLATIYSDEDGVTEIIQDGTDNKSGSDGVVEFYIADGDYYVEAGVVKGGLLVAKLKPFDNVANMTSASYLSKYTEDTLIQWEGYYEKGDGGGNSGLLKFGAHTEDGGSIFSIDSNTYIKANLGGVANIVKFGARDGFDSTSSIKNAIATNLPLKRPAGTYITTDELKVTLSSSDFASFGSGVIKNTVSDRVFVIENPVKTQTTLSSSSSELNSFDVINVSDVNVGDVMIIKSKKSWDASRVDYIAGEILTVKSITGSKIITEQSPNDNYLIGDDVLFYSPLSAYIQDLKIEGDGTGNVTNGQRGIYLKNIYCPTIINPTVINTSRSALEISECYNSQIYGGYTKSTAALAGYSYGLAISSSCGTSVFAGTYSAYRHGVTHGGSFPSRDNKFFGVTMGSDKSEGQASYDEHENVERCRLYGCTITDGMGCGGRDSIYEGCEINGEVRLYLSIDDYHRDQYRRFIDCTINGKNADLTTVRVRPVGEKNSALYLGELEFRSTNVKSYLPSLPLITFSNTFSNTSCTIDSVKFTGSSVQLETDTPATYAIDCLSSENFSIREMVFDGKSVLDSNGRAARLSNNVEKFKFLNSDLISRDSLAVTIDMTGGDLFEFRGSTLDVIGSGFQSTVSVSRAVVVDNDFIGIQNRPFNFTGSLELQTSGNNSPIGTTFDQSPDRHYFIKDNGKVTSYGDAAPSSGSWNRGDRVIVNNPSDLGAAVYVCISSGSPGTWGAINLT